jgi:hypothetical protein
MSTTQEKFDAAEEEKQIAPDDSDFDQISHAEGVGRDYELKCNLSKQGVLSFMRSLMTSCTSDQLINVFKKSACSMLTTMSQAYSTE